MAPHAAMQGLLPGAAKTLLLLMAIVLTPQGSTLPPSTQPRLERTDINVLSIECRVPYHTAWMEGWEIPFAELQILHQGTTLNDKVEVVANLTSKNTKPAIYGRFRDVDLFTATSVRLPETGEGCDSCRKIRVLMALSGPAYYGYYSCEAKSTGKNSRAIYTILVDKNFVLNHETKVNGTLTLESFRADEIHIKWNDRLTQSSGSGEVSVERTVVDKEGQVLNSATILFRIAKDIPLLFKNYETLWSTKSGPDSSGSNKIRMIVKKDTISSPLWRYSCQVSGNHCNGDSKSHTATPQDSDCNCDCGSNSLVTSLFIGLGIVFFLLIFCMIICFVLYCKLRKLRPLRDNNAVVSYSRVTEGVLGNPSGNSAGRQTTPDDGPGNSAGRQTTPDNGPGNSAGPQTTPDNGPGNSAGPQTIPNNGPGNSDGRLTTTGNTPENTVETHATRGIIPLMGGETHSGTGETDEGTDDDNSVGTEKLCLLGVDQTYQSDDNDNSVNAGTPFRPDRLANFRSNSL